MPFLNTGRLATANSLRAVRLSILAFALLLATPAFSVELFRYRGAAKDGGTLEYVFEAGEQNSPNAIKRDSSGSRRRLYDDLLPRTGWRTGNSGI